MKYSMAEGPSFQFLSIVASYRDPNRPNGIPNAPSFSSRSIPRSPQSHHPFWPDAIPTASWGLSLVSWRSLGPGCPRPPPVRPDGHEPPWPTHQPHSTAIPPPGWSLPRSPVDPLHGGLHNAGDGFLSIPFQTVGEVRVLGGVETDTTTAARGLRDRVG